MDILKYPGQDDKHCINFTRIAGSAIYFYEVFTRYMDGLSNEHDV